MAFKTQITQHIIDIVMSMYYDYGKTAKEIVRDCRLVNLPQLTLDEVKQIIVSNQKPRYSDESWDEWQ